MSGSILHIIAYSFAPVLSALAGSVTAVVRTPKSGLRSAIQHFAAGVVFSVVAVELLPDIMRRHRPVWVVVGFALGIAAMIALRWFTESKPEAGAGPGKSRSLPTALIVATGIDILLDGFLIGLGFVTGEKQGKLLVLALCLEMFSLAIATTVTLANSGISRLKAVVTAVLLALAIPLGSLAATNLLGGASNGTIESLLSFGLAALLFLVTEELLVEAHEVPETPWITASFFAGFLLFLVIGMLF